SEAQPSEVERRADASAKDDNERERRRGETRLRARRSRARWSAEPTRARRTTVMEASARRIRRARERGAGPRSGELTAAAAFAATALALILGGAFVVGRLGAMVKAGLAAATVAPPDLPGALRGAAGELLALSAPLLGAAALAALVVGLAQTGGL